LARSPELGQLHLGDDQRLARAQDPGLGRSRARRGRFQARRHAVLGGVGQRDLQPREPAVLLGDVHHAGVGQEGHRHPRHPGQGAAVLEGGGQGGADLGQERRAALRGLRGGARELLAHQLDALLLRAFLRGDVPHEDVDEGLGLEGRRGPAQPAVGPVPAGAPVVEVDHRRALLQPVQVGGHGLAVLGLHDLQDRPGHQLLVGIAQDLAPAGVDLLEQAVETQDPEHVRGQGEEPVEAVGRGRGHDLGQALLEPVLLPLAPLLGLPPHARRVLVAVDEDPDLGAQDLRVDGRADVVHGPQRVAAGHVALLVVGGEEDDGCGLGALPLADEGGRLEAVHARHVHVEQDHREILVQDVLQGLLAGLGLDQVLAQLGQDRLQHDELVGPVVDQEDVDLVVRQAARGAHPSGHLPVELPAAVDLFVPRLDGGHAQDSFAPSPR
jgi:hypothetical protein